MATGFPLNAAQREAALLAVGRRCHISYGGRQDFQYAADVAGTYVRCLEAPYQGAKSYNVRGDVDIRDENHLINLVSALPPNQRVRLTVWRERRLLPVEVVIGDWSSGRSRSRP